MDVLSQLREEHLETYQHSLRVGWLAYKFAKQFNLPMEFVLAAYLHDTGKLKVPRSLLDKPGKLTVEEWSLIKLHPLYALEYVDVQNLPAYSRCLILNHHLHLNGSGYPIDAQYPTHDESLLAIIDVFDAIVHPRSYHLPLTLEQGISYINMHDTDLFLSNAVVKFNLFIKSGGLNDDFFCKTLNRDRFPDIYI